MVVRFEDSRYVRSGIKEEVVSVRLKMNLMRGGIKEEVVIVSKFAYSGQVIPPQTMEVQLKNH